MQRVMSYIQAGTEAGATVLTGGTRREGAGYFIRPTLFTNVKEHMSIYTEEIFGPVGVIVKFKTEDEAISMANNSNYGLSSHIYSQDISRAIRVAHAMEAGNAFVSS